MDSIRFFKVFRAFRIKSFHRIALDRALAQRPDQILFLLVQGAIGKVKENLMKHDETAVMIENCGMEDEKIYRSPEEIPDSAGYYSLIIVKEKGE